jgi:hypothetical protein
MGNLNILPCLCPEDLKPGLDMKGSVRATQMTLYTTKETLYTEPIQNNVSITSIQAIWRGYIQRKHYQYSRKLSYSSSFFPKLDIFETLTGNTVGETKIHEYTYASGTFYTGEWLGGFRNGKGKAIWPDGSTYEGSWSYGYPFGEGIFIHSDGGSFNGKWKNPIFSICESFEKAFADGYRNNYLVWLSTKPQLIKSKISSHQKNLDTITKSIETLEEQISEQKKIFDKKYFDEDIEGIVKDGIFYKGVFQNGLRNGLGVNVWGNGDMTRGYWVNDKLNGWGKSTWVDGSRYFGNYCNDRKEGLGEYLWDDGSKYVGEWKNNLAHGVGMHSWNDERIYVGQWENGLMHGFGVFTWKNGRRYEGGWSRGKKHGIGYSITSDGKQIKNRWDYGNISESNN